MNGGTFSHTNSTVPRAECLEFFLANLVLILSGVPAVLKFLKFQKCPEIVLKFDIVLKFYSFGKNVLKMAFDVQ